MNVLSPSKCCLPYQNGENSSNTQVPKKKRKRKATEQSDAVVRASAHPPTTKLGEDGPLPQVTWRQIHWSSRSKNDPTSPRKGHH